MSKEKSTNQDIALQIEQWKKEHGKVFKIKVTDPSDDKKIYTGYVKKPTKNVMAASAPYMVKDPVKAGDIIRESCYLGGDPEIAAIEEIQIGLNLKMFELFKVAEVEVEEL